MVQTLQTPKVIRRDLTGHFGLPQVQAAAAFLEWQTHLPEITGDADQNVLPDPLLPGNVQCATREIHTVSVRF